MNWTDWYTDKADIYRVKATLDGSLTRNTRELVVSGVPCRIYRPSKHAPAMKQTAATAESQGGDMMACDVSVDICAGDELCITRGAMLGKDKPAIRAFAGEPVLYYEPFGAVIPNLAHQEIALLQQEHIS